MIKFTDYKKQLEEQALASKGDMEDPGWLDVYNETGFINQNTKIGHLSDKQHNKYEIWKVNKKTISSPTYRIGYWDIEELENRTGKEKKNVFIVICALDVSKVKDKLKIKNTVYKNVVQILGVVVDISKNFSSKGIGEALYTFLINELGYTILSDTEQFFGARKLWSRLSKRLDLQVDIINTDTNEIIDKEVILHHGKTNSDFDQRVYTELGTDRKVKIQLVVTKVL